MLISATSRIPFRQHPVRLSGEIWGVIPHFNPSGYKNKLANLRRAAENASRQGLKILVLEALFGADSELAQLNVDRVISRPAAAILWQKERLINLAIELLPSSCDKVVWLDGDVLFENDSWVDQTATLLNVFSVVQPFENAVWLDRDATESASTWRTAPVIRSEIGVVRRERGSASIDEPRGHAGFAWATRRHILQEHSLYDKQVLGGGDSLFAAACFGLSSPEWMAAFWNDPLVRDILHWMAKIHKDIQGSVTCCAGSVYHLWHGDLKRRHYTDRHRILRDNDFDPCRDIAVSHEGTWEWTTQNERLKVQVSEYFNTRKEEG